MKKTLFTAALCAIVVLTCSATPAFAKKKAINVSKLKGIETIAPITIVVDRKHANDTGKKNKTGLDFQSWGSGKLSKAEIIFTETIIKDTLDAIESKSKATFVKVNPRVKLADLPTKKAKKKTLVMDPYIHISPKDIKSAKKAAKTLGVDAVALLYFRHKTYQQSQSSMIPVAKTTKKYAVQTTVIIVDKKGKVRAKGKIKPKYVKGREGMGLTNMGIGTSNVSKGYYTELLNAYTTALEKTIK